jgi:hypothetical protein
MKYFLSLLLFCIGSVYLNAQNAGREQRFEAAAVAGLNLSQLDGDQLRGFRHFGFQGGLRVNAILSERWRAGIELLFSQQGSRRGNIDDRADSEMDIEDVQINMVEVPLLVHFRDWRVELAAGGSYGNIINYTITEVDGEDGTEFHPLSENVFSIILGGSFYFTDHISMEIRWSRWLGSPYDEQAAEENSETIIPWIGRTVSVRGAYTF